MPENMKEDCAKEPFLLVNPDFSEGDRGWHGIPFTAASSGVAEFYDKTFDTYQLLENMPAGTYCLRAQGFYRFGGIREAYAAHNNGSERLPAMMSLNDDVCSFMSLFDESAPYTYGPYTYPDNVRGAHSAFNNDGAYGANEVECTLDARGDLRVGLVKTERVLYDWNCFDNFRLYYVGRPDAIREVKDEDAVCVDVYTAGGVKVRTAVHPAKAVEGLPHGIYIVGKRKAAVM